MYRSSVFILLAWSAFAQVDAGVISGSVYDGSGAVLANTDVQIIDEASNGKLILKTNGSGFYSAPSFRTGQFSASIYDPATTRANPAGTGYIRDLFPGNVIPTNRWDPVAAKLLALYPAPNLAGKNNFFSDQKESVDNDQYIGRIDHRFSEKDTLFGRYATSWNTNILPALLTPPANDPSIVTPEAHNFAASETHIFRANLINEVRIGYQETRETQRINSSRLFDQYGILGAPDISIVQGLPTFAVTGIATLGTTGPGNLPTPATGSGNLPIDKQGRTIQAADNLSWVRGRHTVKFGFDFSKSLSTQTRCCKPGRTSTLRAFTRKIHRAVRARAHRSPISCWA